MTDVQAEFDAMTNGHRETGNFRCTDMGNGERLAFRHGRDLRYCAPWKRWLVWDGRRWALDHTGEVERRAKETVRSIYAEAANAGDDHERRALANHAKSSESRSRIEAMIAQARSEQGIPVTPGITTATFSVAPTISPSGAEPIGFRTDSRKAAASSDSPSSCFGASTVTSEDGISTFKSPLPYCNCVSTVRYLPVSTP